MITIYIKELEEKDNIELLNKIPKFLQKIVLKILLKINIVFINNIDANNKIYLIPDINKRSVYKKIRKVLEKEKTKTQNVQVVLSTEIKKYKEELSNFKIINGKVVMEREIEAVLEKILKENPLALQDIYILTNTYKENSISIIKKLAPKVKSMNIITKQIAKYETLAELLEKEGIILNVANNKRKSLKKAQFIINVDLSQEEIEEYTIFRNSIIINLTQEKIKKLKGFEGIFIQEIEIELEEKEPFESSNLLEHFRKIELYESIKDIRKQEEKVKITTLYGNNGKISEKELRNVQKTLTNIKN